MGGTELRAVAILKHQNAKDRVTTLAHRLRKEPAQLVKEMGVLDDLEALECELKIETV